MALSQECANQTPAHALPVNLDNLWCQFTFSFVLLRDSWEWGGLLSPPLSPHHSQTDCGGEAKRWIKYCPPPSVCYRQLPFSLSVCATRTGLNTSPLWRPDCLFRSHASGSNSATYCNLSFHLTNCALLCSVDVDTLPVLFYKGFF